MIKFKILFALPLLSMCAIIHVADNQQELLRLSESVRQLTYFQKEFADLRRQQDRLNILRVQQQELNLLLQERSEALSVQQVSTDSIEQMLFIKRVEKIKADKKRLQNDLLKLQACIKQNNDAFQVWTRQYDDWQEQQRLNMSQQEEISIQQT